MIEVALVLPIFLLIVFGFINFTLIIFGLCNLTTGVRVANRYACTHSNTSMAPATPASVTAILNPYLFKYPANTQTVTLTYNNGGQNVVGIPVGLKATVTYNIQIFGFTYNGLTVTASTGCLIVQ